MWKIIFAVISNLAQAFLFVSGMIYLLVSLRGLWKYKKNPPAAPSIPAAWL